MHIYYDDLNPRAQREVLEALGVSSPEEANLEFTPLAELLVDGEDDQEKNEETGCEGKFFQEEADGQSR